MARFFDWHGHPDRWHGWHEGWRHRDEPGPPEPGPGFPRPPFPPLPFPLPLFNLETSEGDNDFAAGSGETEMYRHHRPRWARYPSSDQTGERENGFASGWAEPETRRRTGRWIRRNGRIIVLGL
jgi:hypothetical protein